MKEYANKCREIFCVSVRSLYIAMMAFLPKFIPVKISASFFVEIDEQIKQFLWKYKGPRIEQPNRSENRRTKLELWNLIL